MAVTPTAPFTEFQPDPENPGWLYRPASPMGKFFDIFGPVRMRAEGPGKARIRFYPEARHLNVQEGVHGGFTMAVVDQVLSLAPFAIGIPGAIRASTIEASVQFFAPLRADESMDAVVDILRETGRMIFIRGLIEQKDTAAVAFSGTIRKASQRT